MRRSRASRSFPAAQAADSADGCGRRVTTEMEQRVKRPPAGTCAGRVGWLGADDAPWRAVKNGKEPPRRALVTALGKDSDRKPRLARHPARKQNTHAGRYPF